MVAVTTILSAVIGTFVLDIGESVDSDSVQSIGVSMESDGQNVTARVITGSADSLKLLVDGVVVANTSDVDPGDSLSASANKSSEIAVVAVTNGESTVVSTSNPLSESSTTSGSGTITDGLILHYEFESGSGSTAIDSANNYDGNIVGPLWTNSAKVGSYALSLDGVDDYVDSPGYNVSGGKTMSAWVKRAGPGDINYQRVLSYRGGNNDIIIVTHENGWRGVYFNGNEVKKSTGQFAIGDWYHVTLVFNGTHVKYYENGTYIGANTATENALSSPDLFVGARNDASAGWFNGTIDDARFYNRALNSSEVQTLYNSTK